MVAREFHEISNFDANNYFGNGSVKKSHDSDDFEGDIKSNVVDREIVYLVVLEGCLLLLVIRLLLFLSPHTSH